MEWTLWRRSNGVAGGVSSAVDPAVPDQHQQIDAIGQAQFLVNIVEVDLDRAFRDSQPVSDLLVAQIIGGEPDDRLFARRELGEGAAIELPAGGAIEGTLKQLLLDPAAAASD